jgi:hypothetical protein
MTAADTSGDTRTWDSGAIRRHVNLGSHRGPRLTGRHRPGEGNPAGDRRLIAAERRVPADYSPLDPRWRQRMAPTHYAERTVHADVGEATGLLIHEPETETPIEEQQEEVNQ